MSCDQREKTTSHATGKKLFATARNTVTIKRKNETAHWKMDGSKINATKNTTQSMDTLKRKRHKAFSHENRDSEASSKDWGSFAVATLTGV